MNYREEVLRTLNTEAMKDPKALLANGAMGLAGETGEVVDLLKKHLFHGKILDRDKLLKEIGDVFWYLELLMSAVDTTTEEVKALNVAKLRLRYPEGFSTEASVKKADENGH